ncbi:hypothetical protein ABBQ32_008418 [Trebouxia sp. C0010 RCD-2024]
MIMQHLRHLLVFRTLRPAASASQYRLLPHPWWTQTRTCVDCQSSSRPAAQTNTTHKLRPCAPARTLLPTVQTARPAPVPVGAASSKKGVFDPDLACGQETYLVAVVNWWMNQLWDSVSQITLSSQIPLMNALGAHSSSNICQVTTFKQVAGKEGAMQKHADIKKLLSFTPRTCRRWRSSYIAWMCRNSSWQWQVKVIQVHKTLKQLPSDSLDEAEETHAGQPSAQA